MQSRWIGVFMGLFMLASVLSCATVPTEPLGPGDVRLIGVEFPEFGGIKKNVKYLANIKFEADGRPEITRACAYWGVYGPYCMGILDVNYGTGIARIDVQTPPDGLYRFKVFAYYVRDGRTVRTNLVETSVTVVP